MIMQCGVPASDESPFGTPDTPLDGETHDFGTAFSQSEEQPGSTSIRSLAPTVADIFGSGVSDVDARMSAASETEQLRIEALIQEAAAIRQDILDSTNRQVAKMKGAGDSSGISNGTLAFLRTKPTTEADLDLQTYLTVESSEAGALRTLPDEVVLLLKRSPSIIDSSDERYLRQLMGIHKLLKEQQLDILAHNGNDGEVSWYQIVPWGSKDGTGDRPTCPSLISANAELSILSTELGLRYQEFSGQPQLVHEVTKRGDLNKPGGDWSISVGKFKPRQRKVI